VVTRERCCPSNKDRGGREAGVLFNVLKAEKKGGKATLRKKNTERMGRKERWKKKANKSQRSVRRVLTEARSEKRGRLRNEIEGSDNHLWSYSTTGGTKG